MIFRRIVKGISANLFLTGTTILMQIITLPLVLSQWGSNLYGKWLVIFSIPSFISLADIGLGTVVSTEMNMLLASGEKVKASMLFKNAFNFILQLGLIPLFLVITASFLPFFRNWLKLEDISMIQFSLTMVFLSLYSYLSIILTIPMGLYRAVHKFARGQMISGYFRILEFCVFLVCIWFTESFIMVSFAYLVVKLLLSWFVLRDIGGKVNNISYGIQRVEFKEIKTILPHSASMMALYISQALVNQIPLVFIQKYLGSTQVTVFSSIRTLCNFAKQPANIVNLSYWGELTNAFARKNGKLLIKLMRSAMGLTIGVTILTVVFLYFFGATIFSFWSVDKLTINFPLFYLLLLNVVTNLLWINKWNLLLSINDHTKANVYYLLLSIGVIIGTWLFLPDVGLVIIPIALIIFDIIMAIVIDRYFRMKVQAELTR